MKWIKENWITTVVILLAVYMLALGLTDGNYQMTRQKAIVICDECIGLGK